MSGFQSMRTAVTWGAFGLLTGVGVTLAVILVTGVSVADEPGAPLGSERIAVSGDPSTSPSPSLTPNSSGVSVVPAPGPSEVEIDDHGGDRPDDDSSGGSGNGGSGNGGSDNSGSGKGGSDDVESDDD